jgi:hypothetical protein
MGADRHRGEGKTQGTGEHALEGEGKTGVGERGRRALTEADGVRGSARTTAIGALRGRRRSSSAMQLLCDMATFAPGLLCDAAARLLCVGLLFDAAALGLDGGASVKWSIWRLGEKRGVGVGYEAP